MEGGSGGRLGATDYYYAENGAAGVPPGGARSAGAAAALSGSAGGGADAPPLARRPVAYGPEQAMTSLKYCLGPNHSVVGRVLSKVRSLLGGGGGGGHPHPAKAGPGLRVQGGIVRGGSTGRVWGKPEWRSGQGWRQRRGRCPGINWVHSINASWCMRERTKKVLWSVLEGSPSRLPIPV